MSELGILENNTNIENELRIITSPPIIEEVVARLNLNDKYYIKEELREKEIYKCSPVLFHAIDTVNPPLITFSFTINTDDKISVSDIKLYDEEIDGEYHVTFGDTITVANRRFAVVEPDWHSANLYDTKIRFSNSAVKWTAAELAWKISAVLANEKSSIIDISIVYPVISEADDILETIVQVYNERWIQDKNQIAISTSRFINERLEVIEKELGSVDSDISSYKSEHLLPDVSAATAMYMEQSSQAEAAIVNLNNQISVAEMVRKQLTVDSFDQPLPVNTGIVSAEIENAIEQYNNTVIERKRLLESTSDFNPVVKDRTQVLRMLKGNIMASIDAYIATLRTQMSNARRQAVVTSGKIASNPNQTKYLLSVERQQKVKESLYLFLLQKREENELTQAFTAYNTRIVDHPHGSWFPTSPNSKKIWMAVILLGLAIPVGIYVLREMLDTKIRGKKDLDILKVPYIGEIPSAFEKPRGLARLKKHHPTERKIVVEAQSRNAVNEAFRVLRTNLEYMGANDGDRKCKVIAVTSANPGSGKTFISINLAKVLAIKGKRVLVIDLDLRKGSLSKLIGKPKIGITDYLVGKASENHIIVTGIDGSETLNGIAVGIVPPNPAELLSSERLDGLINELREQYDFIILDCPPVEIVTDAKVINRVADLTLFVVRAGLFEKDELPNIQEYYDQNRYRNMAILLNGTNISSGYGYHRYGYHYGYGKHYGYGYVDK